MYEFIMRLRPEFEQTRAQLLHVPSAYSLDEAFAFVRAEKTRLRASFIGGAVPSLPLDLLLLLRRPRLLVLRLQPLIILGLPLG